MSSDHDEVCAEHAARLRELDPLVTAPALIVGTDGVLLSAQVSGSWALGQASTTILTLDSEAALWGPLRQHVLAVRCAGPDREEAVSGLLDQWDAGLAEQARRGDLDSAAIVSWPARDLVGARSLVLHGFAPLTNVAVRPAGQTGPVPERGAAIRLATPADAEVLTELAEDLLRADVPWGALTERPAQREILGAAIRRAVEPREPGDARSDGVVLVSEADHGVTGFLLALSEQASGWAAPLVATSPSVYLSSLYVRPETRSTGVGAALVRAAHERIDQAGIAATLLHHALPSPVSTPFWARMGYRPLRTIWQRRPAVR